MRNKSENLKTFPFISITDPSGPYMKCMALDPRYKRRQCISAATWKAIKDEAAEIMSGEQMEFGDLRPVSQGSLASLLDGPKHVQGRVMCAIDSEIAQFLKTADLPPDDARKVLQFWSSNSSTLPILVKLAQKYLCIQPTSVPSERLFSEAGRVYCNSRASLEPGLVSALVFVHDNDEDLIRYRAMMAAKQ